MATRAPSELIIMMMMIAMINMIRQSGANPYDHPGRDDNGGGLVLPKVIVHELVVA